MNSANHEYGSALAIPAKSGPSAYYLEPVVHDCQTGLALRPFHQLLAAVIVLRPGLP